MCDCISLVCHYFYMCFAKIPEIQTVSPISSIPPKNRSESLYTVDLEEKLNANPGFGKENGTGVL